MALMMVSYPSTLDIDGHKLGSLSHLGGWQPLNIPQHAFGISAPCDDKYQRTPAEESIHENSNPSFTQSLETSSQ